MKTRKVKKKADHRPLKWIVGLEVAAILAVGLILAVLLFNPHLLGNLPNTLELPTLTPISTFSLAPTAVLFPTLTATIPPPSSVSPAPTVLEFDLSRANQVPPSDVLQEVGYYSGGGPTVCRQVLSDHPYMLGSSGEPQVIRAEWFSPMYLTSCSWPLGETVAVTVTFQGSTYWTGNAIAEYFIFEGRAQFWFSMPTPRELGDYMIVMDSPSSHLEATLNVYQPATPRLYSIGDTELALYSFVPGETIRLFAYDFSQGIIRLAGWTEHLVESAAPLIFKVSNEKRRVYFVVGSISGLVEDGTDTAAYLGRSILVKPCGGTQSYLSLFEDARVSTSLTSAPDLRSEPDYSSQVTGQVPMGMPVNFHERGICVDNTLWWHIYTDGGHDGWIPEYQDGTYLLEPAP